MTRKTKRKAKAATALPPGLESINLNAAALDIGSTEHYVAVPPERSEQAVRTFGSYTAALHEMARWLKECGITTIALESTGSYWIAPYQLLEASGFEVVLVNSRHVKNLPGRKSDVLKHPLLEKTKKKTLKAQGNFELKHHLYAICGADLTQVEGLEVLSVQALLSEIGLDMTRWKSEKHFTSWLNLSPPSRISGGKPLSRQPRKGHNRAADILRLCAQSALKSKSALGAFGRRLKARLDAPKAIKAVAHKLARIVYRMLKYGQQYRDAGERYYEEKYQHHLIRRLHQQAAAFGFQLTPQQASVTTVS